MIQVTMREWTVLTFIQSYIKAHGYSPTIREIKQGCGIGKDKAHQIVNELEEVGILTKRSRRARTIALCGQVIGVMP